MQEKFRYIYNIYKKKYVSVIKLFLDDLNNYQYNLLNIVCIFNLLLIVHSW